jgi:hypothetical protein
LIVPRDNPRDARAIEFKRVALDESDSGSQRIRRVSAIDEGFAQAEGLVRLGYHESYLGLIVASDIRSRVSDNSIFNDPGMPARAEILGTPQWGSLSPDVGLLWVELNQGRDASINSSGAVSLCVLKPARKQEQLASRSQLLARILADTCACGHHEA